MEKYVPQPGSEQNHDLQNVDNVKSSLTCPWHVVVHGLVPASQFAIFGSTGDPHFFSSTPRFDPPVWTSLTTTCLGLVSVRSYVLFED